MGKFKFSTASGKLMRNLNMKHWFLLEKELADAIAKGRRDLLDLAWARIKLLKKEVDPNLFKLGFEDREKRALEEENDLIDFILSKEYMIHPNVIKMVRTRDTEGIRLALNPYPLRFT